METYTAIVLFAGKGNRMNSDIPKQYLQLEGKPVLAYSLEAFEKSRVDNIILVTGEADVDFCKTEIVEKYGLKKVKAIVTGGKERYHSVFAGLKAAGNTDYVLIHDGARPLLTEDIISRMLEAVRKTKACVAGMHVKDTIKITNEQNEVQSTPDRRNVWMVQTPQAFSYSLIYRAYEKLMEEEDDTVTDDAMVVEKMCHAAVTLVEGSYTNLKITTPEDMILASAILKSRE